MSNKRSDIAHPLLDKVIADHNLRNDLGLARFLGVVPSALSKIRNASANGGVYRNAGYRVSGDMMILIHEKTGMSIKAIKELAA